MSWGHKFCKGKYQVKTQGHGLTGSTGRPRREKVRRQAEEMTKETAKPESNEILLEELKKLKGTKP